MFFDVGLFSRVCFLRFFLLDYAYLGFFCGLFRLLGSGLGLLLDNRCRFLDNGNHNLNLTGRRWLFLLQLLLNNLIDSFLYYRLSDRAE